MRDFDFDHALTTPFRMQPGLRKLCAGAAQLTALPALAQQAQHEHHQAFAVDSDGAWHAPRQWGWRVGAHGQVMQTQALWPDAGPCLQNLAPSWRQAALLCSAFPEDFAIVDDHSGCVPWLADCLPSHWVASVSADVLAYRGLATVQAPLLAWLAQQAQGHRP